MLWVTVILKLKSVILFTMDKNIQASTSIWRHRVETSLEYSFESELSKSGGIKQTVLIQSFFPFCTFVCIFFNGKCRFCLKYIFLWRWQRVLLKIALSSQELSIGPYEKKKLESGVKEPLLKYFLQADCTCKI